MAELKLPKMKTIDLNKPKKKKVLLLFYTIQTQDFGNGCIEWNMRLEWKYQYSIIIFGMIYHIQCGMSLSMKVVI